MKQPYLRNFLLIDVQACSSFRRVDAESDITHPWARSSHRGATLGVLVFHTHVPVKICKAVCMLPESKGAEEGDGSFDGEMNSEAERN